MISFCISVSSVLVQLFSPPFRQYIVQRRVICFRSGAIIGNLFGYRDDNELFSLTPLLLSHLEHDLDEFCLIILSELSQDQLAHILEIYHSFLLHLKGVGQWFKHFQLQSNKF